MTTETKKPRANKAAPAASEAPVTVTAYKGFDKNLQCRGYQYEVGKTYTHTGRVVQCESGFHACQNPLDVLDYYCFGDDNRFAKVTLSGEIDRSDDCKWASGVITIDIELRLPGLIAEAVKWVMDACKAADTVGKGYSSKLAASGDSSKLAASGYSSQLAASGNSSQLAASGDSSKLAASGDSSKLEVTGAKSAAAAVGPNSRIKAAHGTPIAICEYDASGAPLPFVAGVAGVDGVPADTWLKAENGKLVEA